MFVDNRDMMGVGVSVDPGEDRLLGRTGQSGDATSTRLAPIRLLPPRQDPGILRGRLTTNGASRSTGPAQDTVRRPVRKFRVRSAGSLTIRPHAHD